MKADRHIIWSNYALDYEDWRVDLEAEYPDLSDHERENLMYEINGNYLDDERANLTSRSAAKTSASYSATPLPTVLATYRATVASASTPMVPPPWRMAAMRMRRRENACLAS